jgi:hypothetical protein
MEPFDASISGTSVNIPDTLSTPVVTLQASSKATQKTNLDTASSTVVQIKSGLFDSRLGRGVSLLTIDIDALKAPFANFSVASSDTSKDADAISFRTDFNPNAASTTLKPWNGLIYIEFPTSLALASTSIPALTAEKNTFNGIETLRFAYSSTPEYLHPDRADATDSTRAARHDNIVPFDRNLRRYPPAASANLNSTILDAQYVIPAVQLINALYLPHPNSTNTKEGFTIATNAPVYVVGNYNSDGDFTTGSNITSNAPGSYAQPEVGATAQTSEITAAIFCDTFTVLSNGWGLNDATTSLSNRNNSFYGTNNGSTNNHSTSPAIAGNIGNPPGRPAKSLWAATTKTVRPTIYHYATKSNYIYPNSNPTTGSSANPYVEISACIATGEYPIFEFFNHALEDYEDMYNTMSSTKANPIIFKGSVVGMFHSEIQHIKQAYGRSVSSNVQTSGDPSGDIWQQHGAYAIAATRYSQFLVDGNFPPGTPKAYYTSQKNYSLLHWNDSADAAVLTQAGFTAP